MNQKNTPLYDALKQHMNQAPVSFHVPGHKYGSVFPDFAWGDFHSLLRMDATELTGLDDLHDPREAILEAERLAADSYGVTRSRFLVNGSSVGNLAMILGVCAAGDIVLVQRNCHKSVWNGLQLAGARPVLLTPEVDPLSQVPIGITFETIREAVKAYPETKAVILTYPNYYGAGIDLKEMVSYLHQLGIPILVDEAHGAHFGIGEPFPQSAIGFGADVVVQSAHKTLPAMTMGSYIHFNSSMVDQEKVNHYLRVLQSSSPSYPLMASLDVARWYRANMNDRKVAQIANEIASFRRSLEKIPQIKVLGKGIADVLDPLKVTVQTNTSLIGYELQALFEKAHIFTELSDPLNVLFVLPLGHMENMEDIVNKLERSLESYPVQGLKQRDIPIYEEEKVTIFPFSYAEMNRFQTEKIPLHESVGRLAAESIIPYPPGVPLIADGERISEGKLQHLAILHGQGANFQGNNPFQVEGIRVYKN